MNQQQIDREAVGHIVAGWSEGFTMVHACVFHRQDAAYRFVSVYFPDIAHLVRFIQMVQPDAVTIVAKRFPGGEKMMLDWRVEAA